MKTNSIVITVLSSIATSGFTPDSHPWASESLPAGKFPIRRKQTSGQKSELLAIVLFLFLFFSISLNAAPVPWSGHVVDARTGAPVPGIECYGGGSGRVDLTPQAFSDATGNYVVTYEDGLDLESWKFYALTARDPLERYFRYRRSQVSPTPLLVRLVPKLAFIQGTVRDAATGQPLADVPVSLGRPGRVIETVITDPAGSYRFNHPAYDGGTNEETIPEDERAEPTSNPTIPISNYWLRINLAGYRSMDTAARDLSLTVQSSITDAIHTQVNFTLAPDGSTPEIENITTKLNTPTVSRMTGSTLMNGEVGQALSYQIAANNPLSGFSASGLPAGLVLEPTTGLITGTPETAGLFTVELRAAGPEGEISQRLTLVVRTTDDVVFDNGNIGGVRSGPTQPTTFTLADPTRITFVSNYHYFNGGILPGTIVLRHEDGTTYGPWQTSGKIGQGGVLNAYWDAWPVVILKSGNYTVVDSHPATWSYNSQSGNRGFTIIRGSSTTLDTAEVLATWAANHGLTGGDTAPTADPDVDGQANWIELAMGSNPARPDAAPGVSLIWIAEQMSVQLPVCAGGIGIPGSDFVINGAHVTIEVTSDLGTPDWQPGITLLDLANATRNDQGNGRELLTLPLKGATVPQGPWFIRRQLTRIETP